MSFIYNPDQNIGELHNILYSKGLVFAGSEIDMSIRPGWFYHSYEEPHSLERLFNTYVNSCGSNTSFNLNIPPMPSGRFDPRDIIRLKELGEALENAFGESKKVPFTAERVQPDNPTQCKYELKLEKPTEIGYVELMEDLSAGQRVEHFRIYAGETCLYQGYTVGHRKLCKVDANTDTLTVFITGARDEIVMREIGVYAK